MRGGVEDDVGSFAVEKPAEPRAIADVEDDRRDGTCGVERRERLHRLEDAVLPAPDEDEAPRPEADDLPSELSADRSAAAGDEHGAIAERVSHRIEVDPRRSPPQEVLELDLAQRVDRHATGDDLGHARDGEAARSRGLRLVHELPQGPTVRRRQREEHRDRA